MLLHRTPILLAVMLALLALVPGCEYETRTLNSTWTDSFGELADRRPTPRGTLDPSDPRVRSPDGYAVEIARFTGEDASAQAFRLASDLRINEGLAELWQTDGSSAAIVYAGRFQDPRSDRAKTMLQQIRNIRVANDRPYAGAQLVALSEAIDGDNVYNEYDLRNHAGSLTLQIGFYDGNFGSNFRAAAESAVDILRTDGEDAYFYHGTNRSLITIGLFSQAEALVPNGQTEQYSPAVRAIQERFPHNLMNGVTFERRENGIGGVQPSFIVTVR